MNFKKDFIGKVGAGLLCALFSAGLVACGGSGSSSNGNYTPETTSVKGDLSDYFEVVEKEYAFTDIHNTVGGDEHTTIFVELKRTDKDLNFDPKTTRLLGKYIEDKSGLTGLAGFGIEVLDKDGNVISKVAASSGNLGKGGTYEGTEQEMKEAINLKPGETATIRCDLYNPKGKKGVKFRITSAYEECDGSAPAPATTTTTSSSSSYSYDSSFSDDYESTTLSKPAKEAIDIIEKATKDIKNAKSEAAVMKIVAAAEEKINKLDNKYSDFDYTSYDFASLLEAKQALSEAIQEFANANDGDEDDSDFGFGF